MNAARRLLQLLIAAELAAAAACAAWRLGSTRVLLPPAANYHDAGTGAELAALPERYLFDSLQKWKQLAEATMAYGHFAVAEACFARAKQYAVGSNELAYNHALCLERVGALEEAAALFEQVARRGTGLWSARAWYRAGLLALRQEEAGKAEAAFIKAGEGHFPALFQRAKLQIRSGEAHRAGPLLDRLELNHPEDLNVRLLRSAWARALVQPEAAARADDAAGRARATLVLDDTELFLKPIRRQYGLVRDFALARDQAADTQAMRAFSRRILDDPLWRNFYLLTLQDAAALLMSYPHTQWARPLLERQFREQQFPTAEYWELLGSVLEKEDEPEQAWQAWNKAVRMAPNAQRHAQVARLARKRDEPALAEIHERRARLLEGCEFLDANQVENAHDRFQEVVARDPQDAQAWFLLGETERLRGDDEAARQNYEQCLRLNPDNGRARARLGMP